MLSAAFHKYTHVSSVALEGEIFLSQFVVCRRDNWERTRPQWVTQGDFRLVILLSGRPSERDARLLPRQHGCQKPEFGLHFARIGHRIGDLLAKEFAIPLA